MRKESLMAVVVLAISAVAFAQSNGPAAGKWQKRESGPSRPAVAAKERAAQRPAPPRYANMPEAAVPFGKFTEPYKKWFVEPDTLAYYGAARDSTPPAIRNSTTVNIGFLGPLDAANPDTPYGQAMLNGATMAVEQANAAGGWRGRKPFALKVHDDLPLWGASSIEFVKMDFDDHVVAVLGAVNAASTHIMLRMSLKLEIPIMDTATSDPTVTQTRVQWLMHDFPDDRQQGYALADYIFNQMGIQRIGIVRPQERYGRMGVEVFVDEARRLGHEPLVEMKFNRGDTDFARQLGALEEAQVQGILIWGEPPEAGLILKQMRAMGMEQPVFGSSRLAYPELLKIAGPAAEGMVVTSAINPANGEGKWISFRQEYQTRFHERPDGYAAYGYDGMTILIQAIDKAGLNRGRVMDALRAYEMKAYEGAAGRSFFDYTLNDIAPVWMARVQQGKFVYFPGHRWAPGAANRAAQSRR